MHLPRLIVNVEHHAGEMLHLQQLRALPLAQKLLHRKTRRHLIGLAIGAFIAYAGAFLAEHKDAWLYFMPHTLADTVAFIIHAVGAFPLVEHSRPLWDIFKAEAA